MTVASAEAKAGPYTGNDAATTFAFAFKVFADTDIRVVETLIATGVETTLTLNGANGYTVVRNNDQDNSPGGTITYRQSNANAALPSTKKLTIVGNFAFAQPTDLPNGGPFFAQVVENALDRVTLLVKQLRELLGRALTMPVSAPAGTSTTVPLPEAGKALGWNPTGTALANIDITYPAGIADLSISQLYGQFGISLFKSSVGRVVDSISGLRALDKTRFNRAFAVGYYQAGDGGGGEYWYDSADITTADNGGTVVVASDGGRWKLRWVGQLSIKQFGAVGDGATHPLSVYFGSLAAAQAVYPHVVSLSDEMDWTATTAAVSYMGGVGGGVVHAPKGTYLINRGIDNKYARVRLEGASRFSFHDAGTDTNRTIFKATSAITMMKIRSPYAAELGVAVSLANKNYGAGCTGIEFDGNNVATNALLIDSVSFIDVSVYATGIVTGPVFDVTCGITGTNLGDVCDVQHSRLEFRARQIDTAGQQAVSILRLGGSSNANVSLNRGPLHGISLLCQHYNGDALDVVTADNNDISVSAIRVAPGTGRTVLARGQTASFPVGCESNNFVYVGGNGAVYAQGTSDGGVTAGVINRIENLDTGNGTPPPTIGTGSRWQYVENSNVTFGAAFTPIAIANDAAAAKTARAAMGSETVRVYNASSNHTVLEDQLGNRWGVGIDGATGDLRVLRLAGAGAVNVGNGAAVKVPGSLAITGNVGFFGAAVSGKPNITGSRGGNAALASLLSNLAAMGLITDGST